MSRVVPGSIAAAFVRAYPTANATDTSFASRPDTLAEPTGDGIVSLAYGLNAAVGPSWASLIFIGTGDANDAFDVKIYGVRQVGDSWTFVPLLCLTATLGAKTGVADGGVLDTELYADTLVVKDPSYGVADASYRLVSPAGDSVGRLLLDTEGFAALAVDFDTTTGNPTGANALVAPV